MFFKFADPLTKVRFMRTKCQHATLPFRQLAHIKLMQVIGSERLRIEIEAYFEISLAPEVMT